MGGTWTSTESGEEELIIVSETRGMNMLRQKSGCPDPEHGESLVRRTVHALKRSRSVAESNRSDWAYRRAEDQRRESVRRKTSNIDLDNDCIDDNGGSERKVSR
jgi:hypothetical protein